MSGNNLGRKFTAEAIRRMRPSKNAETGRWRAPPLSRRRQKLALQQIARESWATSATNSISNSNSAIGEDASAETTNAPTTRGALLASDVFGAPAVPEFFYDRENPNARTPKGRLFERRAEARFQRIQKTLAGVDEEVEKHRRQVLLEKWKLKKMDKGSGLLIFPVKRPSQIPSAQRSLVDQPDLDPLPIDSSDPAFLVNRMKETKQRRKDSRSS